VTPQRIPRTRATFQDPSFRRAVAISALASISYYVTAKVGFEFTLQPGSVSALWMPNAIVLAGLLLTSRRWWWLVLLATLPAHVASEFQSGVPTLMVLSWFVSNSVQALLGAVLINYFSGTDIKLDRTKDLTTFLVFGAFLAPFLASFLDAALVKLNHWGSHSYWEVWQVRVLSNVLAVLILVPFIIEWSRGNMVRLLQSSVVRYAEAALLLGTVFAVGFIVFNTQQNPLVHTPSRLYWHLPFLLWATVRFGLRGVSTILLIVMFLAIIGATRGSGPFSADSASENALSIQMFLIIVAVPLLALAAIIKERHLTEEALAEINARNQAILRAMPDTMFLQNREGIYLDYYTRDPKGLLVSPPEFLGKSAREVLPGELAERLYKVIDRLAENDQPQVLEYSLPIGDEERHYEARVVNAGGPHVLSIVRDVTEARRSAEAVRKSEQRLSQSTRKIRSLAGRLITAQESERRRIAILLHDDVGQNVAALSLAISRLKRRLPDDSELMLAELDRVGAQLENLTTQIRQLSHQLHPEILEHLGLVKALEARVAELGNEQQIEVRFAASTKTDPIPVDVAVCLYRVALEALRNVSLHSGSTQADVALNEADGWLTLQVSDSGKGFDVEKLRHGIGLGLASSEERVKLLHGSLDVRSDSQSGTRLTARVPLFRTQ
jgi:signal transduction histidine kinase